MPRSAHHPSVNGLRLKRLLQLTAGFVLAPPVGLSWTFGNLIVYVNSYTYASGGGPDFQMPWLLPLYDMAWCASMVVGGFLIRHFDPIVIRCCAVVLFNLGLFLSRLSVERSVYALLLTLGLFSGTGSALLQAQIFDTLAQTMGGKAGQYVTLVMSAFLLGGALDNVVITWYINPDNLVADMKVGHVKIFTDKSVIDRVPSLFIVLGSISASLHVVGVGLTLLLRCIQYDDNASECSEGKDESPSSKQFSDDQRNAVSDEHDRNSHDSYRNENYQGVLNGISGEQTKLLPTKSKKGQYSCRQCKYHLTNENCEDDTKVTSRVGGNSTHGTDLSPWQMFKTPQFYVLLFCNFICGGVEIVLINSYKEYAQLWIDDDHFLSTVGVASFLFVFVSISLFSFLVDKINFKDIHVTLTSGASLTLLFFPYAPQINPWFYLACVCLSMSINVLSHANIQVMVLKLFGKAYFGLNFGIVMISSFVVYGVGPFLTKAVLELLGWHAVFLGTGATNVVLLVVCLVFLPRQT